ncbi:MAG: DnaJ domain-containing protein [Pseudomonadota bacterium]
MSPSQDTRARSDALKTLGLHKGANLSEIRQAWRKIAFETHPDRNDGVFDGFVKAKAAYDLLCEAEKPAPQAPKPEPAKKPAPKATRPVRPERPGARRPQANARSIAMTQEMLSACQALLDGDRLAGEVTSHLPTTVERQGRSLTYIVLTKLGPGKNRIALPTSVLEDHRKVNPKIVSFNASAEGSKEIEIPQSLREKLFPGARSVHIRFGLDAAVGETA